MISKKIDSLSNNSSRRGFLKRSSMLAGSVVSATVLNRSARASETSVPPSWKTPGAEFSNYGQPVEGTGSPIRWISADRSAPGNGVSWCPLHELAGTITPNSLHFERHHNGVPFVDAEKWELLVHGRVKKPLLFNLSELKRYPLISRTVFIECGGNSNSMWYPTPVQASAGYVHGLVSCSEWTGVALSTLLNEAGLLDDARWMIADALDAAGVAVSLPIEKILSDSFIALYQNGEPVRPANGYPARLIVPGWEGITHVKWLRSLQLSAEPAMTKFDTVSYTDLKPDGTADRFSYPMQVKSLITSPSAGMVLSKPGPVELRGLAWSGNGTITRVEISADNGKSWQDAVLQKPVLDKSLTRFRLPWSWTGDEVVLMSRAHDSANHLQVNHSQLLAEKGSNHYHHYNAMIAWQIDTNGTLHNVYS